MQRTKQFEQLGARRYELSPLLGFIKLVFLFALWLKSQNHFVQIQVVLLLACSDTLLASLWTMY